MDRRRFLQTSILTAAAVTTSAAKTSRPGPIQKQGVEIKNSEPFWPNGARLVVSVSMQFEAGAQPERGAESPFPVNDTMRGKAEGIDAREGREKESINLNETRPESNAYRFQCYID